MSESYTAQLFGFQNRHQEIQQSSLECCSAASAYHPCQSIQILSWVGMAPGYMKDQVIRNSYGTHSMMRSHG